MDSRRQEIEADLQEIDRLLNLSTRNFVKEILVSQRLRLGEELKSLPITSSPQQKSPSESIQWRPLDKYAWEQTEDEVKIYVTSLGDLKNHPKDKIVVEHTNNSIEVAVKDFNNANFKLKFVRLNKDIKSARVTAKSNGFSLTMKKKDKGNWETIEPKKSVAVKNDETEKEETKDPGDGLMNMMKELYENGDDDMKKTIAEAWSKSKDKENT